MDALDRERIGRRLYLAINRDCFVKHWNDLPDNRRERYRIAAEELIKSEEVDTALERLRRRIAA